MKPASNSSAVAVDYFQPDAIKAYLAENQDYVAGVVGFGVTPADYQIPSITAWVDTPVFGDRAIYEVWTGAKPVQAFHADFISGMANDEIIFANVSVQVKANESLGSVSYRAYCAIFEFLREQDCRHLARIWNYFPAINAIENGLERYRDFCVGRSEAFGKYHRTIQNAPAACALGSHAGTLVIYFLATRAPLVQIENPRQVSAYHYPERYGPSSPTFSRATLANFSGASNLFISGTASIVGHETLHAESLDRQMKVALENIRIVIEQASDKGFVVGKQKNNWMFKAYVRHAEDLQRVHQILLDELGQTAKFVVLQMDICRADLLLEIEAVGQNNIN